MTDRKTIIENCPARYLPKLNPIHHLCKDHLGNTSHYAKCSTLVKQGRCPRGNGP